MLKTNEVTQIWKPFHLKKMAFEKNITLASTNEFENKKHAIEILPNLKDEPQKLTSR